jgi:glycosyltransferase involved in cell wall biosynthesis
MIVAGDFRVNGGMDRANFELARYLLERGDEVHLVANSVAAELGAYPGARIHLASRPAGSFLLGSFSLDLMGRRMTHNLRQRWPRVPVIVNGGNCLAGNINWAHYVHAAWSPENTEMPAWLKSKQSLEPMLERARERRTYARAQLVIANSNLTKRHVEAVLGEKSRKVITIYCGANVNYGPVTDAERIALRDTLGISRHGPIAFFVGALGHDNRKGFDILFEAWRRLCATSGWDVELIVAGDGRAFPAWKRAVVASGLANKIHMVGFVPEAETLVGAGDLLISPVRYEAYGLNVQEALCRGVPAVVSANAGIAERFSTDLRMLLLKDPTDVDLCVEKLKLWRADIGQWKRAAVGMSAKFRARSWQTMAAEIVCAINEINDLS